MGKKSIIFYNLAFNNAFEGQKINFERIENEAKEGDIIKLKEAKLGIVFLILNPLQEIKGNL